MPDGEEQPQERVSFFPGFTNWWKENSNKYLHTWFHYRVPVGQPIDILPTWRTLQEEINFEEIKKINKEMIEAERWWDGGTPESEEISAGKLRERVRELYLQLGHYYDIETLSREMGLTQTGTGEKREAVTINIPGLGERTLEFTVPTEQNINFSHGLSYNLAFVGTQNNTYFTRLGTAINRFLKSIEDEMQLTAANEVIRQNIKNNITKINTAMSISLRDIGEYLTTFETAHRSFLSGLDEKAQAGIGPLRGIVEQRRLDPQWVVYRHTYKIIKPFYLKSIIDKIIEEIKDTGEIVTRNITAKKPVYFNPDVNPYKDELGDVEQQIGDPTEAERKKQDYSGQVNQINEELRVKNEEIKKLLSGYIEKYFGRDLLRYLYKELDAIYTKKEDQIKDFLTEIKKKIVELLGILKRPQIKYFHGLSYVELEKNQYFTLHTGQKLKDLNDLLIALQNIDEETFRFHVNEQENHFGNWVRDMFGDMELARAIFNAGTNRDAMIQAVRARLSAISGAQYREKLNEFFAFIEEKIKEFNIKVNSVTKNDIDRLKRTLMQLPSIINDETIEAKKKLFLELYRKLYNSKPNSESIINDHIKALRSRLNNFLREVLSKIKDLAGTQEQELERKKNELFELVIDKVLEENGITSKEEISSKKEQLRLEESQITDEVIKKIKRITYVNFNLVINAKKIMIAKKSRAEILLKMNNILKEFKELAELLFRRERLNYYIAELKPNLGNFTPKDNEEDWGLDENGWPLEVAETGYRFKAPQDYGRYDEENIEQGTILLDVFNRKKPYRKVPSEFIGDCDLLDMSVWVYVNYDAYRDDLRDGRYHKKSLSVMEYILQMKEIETPYLEFKSAKLKQPLARSDTETEHTSAIMKLHNPPNRPTEVKVGLGPSQFNPAFDIRRGPVESSKKDIHLGRKLYYDIQDNTEQSSNPTMSTRGAALWILARVIEDTKDWNEAIKLLDAIGTKTLGFDIGPNLQGVVNAEGKIEPKRWGKVLTKNPFEPIKGEGWSDIT